VWRKRELKINKYFFMLPRQPVGWRDDEAAEEEEEASIHTYTHTHTSICQ